MNATLTLPTRRATLVFVILIAILVISSELMFIWIRSTEANQAELFENLNEIITPLEDVVFMADRLSDANEDEAASLLAVMQREADQVAEHLALADTLPDTNDFRATFQIEELRARQRSEAILEAIARLNALPITAVSAAHPDVILVQTQTPQLVADLIAHVRQQRAEFAQVTATQRAINIIRIVVIVASIGGYAFFVHYPLLDRVQSQAESLAAQVEQVSRSEAALREQKTMFESVLWTTPGFVFVYDIGKDEFVYSSQPIWSFFGFDEQVWNAFNASQTFEFVMEEDHAKVFNALGRLVQGEEHVSFELRAKDAQGNLRWYQTEIVPFRVDGETLTQIVGTVTEHTELKKAYAEREQQARLLEQVTYAAPEMIYLLDTASRQTIYQNVDVRDLLGYPKDQWAAYDPDPFDHLIHPADVERKYAHFEKLSVLRDDEMLELEFRMRAADGTWRTIRSVDRVFSRDASGRVASHVGVLHDITDWREAEKRAFQLHLERERMRVNAEFIANSSHELRTPLTVIAGTAYLMSRSDDPAARAKRLAEIEKQIAHLTKLVDDLQTLATLDAEPMHVLSEVDLNRVVHNALQMCDMAALRVAPRLNLADVLPLIPGDEHLLTQACRNVIQNAFLYSPSDSPIDISTHSTSTHVFVTVSDHGPGIAEQDIPYIFDRFYKADKARSSGGTGLGLAMVKKIVETHGGTVDVRSTSGGSTFELSFSTQPERRVGRAAYEASKQQS